MKNDVAESVKVCITEIEPSATIFLYGSHCRVDCAKGIDWDFLILVDGPVDSARADRLRHAIYRIASLSLAKVNAVIKCRADWEAGKERNIPLFKRISNEGIEL
jgi:uncharacterized protein